MEQTKDTIITLIDENGREVEFDLVLSFDYEKRRFAALFPLEDVENVADDEIVLLEIIREDGGEIYRPIENEVYQDEVFDAFMELWEEMDEDEDAEE
ncbi:MAG: DUF1292 domain-containing protein [Clostridiales bacterium]|nr:DUF1292 domain-containing protein [Clostridiales bacterium]